MARQASRIYSSLVYERQTPRRTLSMLLSDASCAPLVPSVSCPVPLAFSTRPAPQLEDRQVPVPITAASGRCADWPETRADSVRETRAARSEGPLLGTNRLV
ncbi:hypothetical protein CSOJ01_12082 [Colletotrichum sojae]|uniref:Uncharacterized protein n=1 Tax=Colletotrichum sojae TaxID=2175907 RepID=A0A8H6MM77_9PEZI|nr:hypothetical protein CSOJ01_12082 [Colletotrichum sojae]